MKFADASKPNRKSGVRLGEPGAPVLFLGGFFLVRQKALRLLLGEVQDGEVVLADAAAWPCFDETPHFGSKPRPWVSRFAWRLPIPPPRLHVEEAALQRDHDGVGTITGVELGENALEVAFDSVLGDAKMLSNDLVGTATGYPAKGFQLPPGERVVSNMLGHFHGDFLRDATVACVHEAYGVNQLRAQHTLEKISGGSRLEGPQGLHVASVGGEDNDASGGPLLANRCDGVDSVGLGHAQIHERDVGAVSSETGDGLVAICRLGHYGHVGLGIDRA
jgi:hypothetical protein